MGPPVGFGNNEYFDMITKEVKSWTNHRKNLKMKVAMAQFTGKNWKMNEDTWGGLDTWEQRDHELTIVNLNDAPVRFGELKAGMNNSEKLGSGESNWRDSWIAPDGYGRNYHNRKQLWEEGIKLEPWILKRMEQDLREILLRSSKSENDDEKHHHELLRHSGRIKRKRVEPKMKRIWKRPWRRHVTNENSFLRQTWKWIWEWLREN